MSGGSFTHHYHTSVQIFDTDCYGVMWHGAYHRWLELSRCLMFEALGCPLSSLSELEEPLVFPVAKQELIYHAPANLWDHLNIQTRIEQHGVRIVFYQTIINHKTQALLVTANTTCAIMAAAPSSTAGQQQRWRPARQLPQMLKEALALALAQPSMEGTAQP